MATGEDMESGTPKDIPPWLQPVPEEEFQEASFVSGKLKIAMIAGAVIILSLFVAVIFYLYDDNAAMAPIHVEAPTTSVKERPQERGGMKVDHQDKVIFDQRDGVQQRGEVKLEAQPETPVEEVPDEPANDPIADVIEQTATETPATATPATATPEPAVSKPEPAAEKPAESKPEPASEPAVSLENSFRVQLGAYGSENSASRSWRTVRGRFATYFAGKQPQYEPVQTGDRTLYRLRVGPFENRAAADQVCLALRAQEQACIVVNP